MGTHLGIENYDKLFGSISSEPIIVNKMMGTLENERKTFDDNFFVTYTDTDIMDTIPKCPCGKTKGQRHVDRRGKGTICKDCQQPVQQVLDKPLEPIIWVEKPSGVDALINPQAWRLLSDFFSLTNNSNQKFNLIKYLTNTNYHPNQKHHGRWMDLLDDMGIRRGGLNHFYWNFDEIIGQLLTIKQFSSTKEKKEKTRKMKIFIAMYRDSIFADRIPIHNKTIMVIENTRYGTYMDTNLKTIIDAVRNIAGVDSDVKGFTTAQKENSASKLTESLSEFGEDYEKSFLAGKPGLIRKHVYATRCWFSFRAVINALSEPHHHDELHLPWSVGVTSFRIHLLGKLYRRGYGYNDASAFLNYHTHVFHPLLATLFDELIEESPHILSPMVEETTVEGIKQWDVVPEGKLKPKRGIPCIFGRNPSMYRTSIQRMFITKVKHDVTTFSISYPITSVAGPNADFDGKLRLLSLNLSNCWEVLRALLPQASRKQMLTV